LSRFDLLFLLLDKPNMDDDLRLAQHVTYVHMHLEHPRQLNEPDPIDIQLFRHYIAVAKTFQPILPSSVADYIVNAYVHMRNNDDEMADFQYTCARTLLSIIRMASSLARLRFAREVDIGDVDEALRLMETSKSSLLNRQTVIPQDPLSLVFDIIRDMSTIGSSGQLRKEIA
jgi:DNA replication licensing factor MCM7